MAWYLVKHRTTLYFTLLH